MEFEELSPRQERLIDVGMAGVESGSSEILGTLTLSTLMLFIFFLSFEKVLVNDVLGFVEVDGDNV